MLNSAIYIYQMDNKHQHDNLLKVIDELEDYAFLFLDINGNVQTWNIGAQNIKGYFNEEIIGSSFKKFYTVEDLKSNKPEYLLESAKNKGKAQDEGWRIRKDGSRFWANVTITAVHDERGNVIGFGKLTRDLTHRMQAEQAMLLDIKNKELEQFNYIASHDLQEPLRTISNYIQILNEDFGDDLKPEAKKYLDTISRATNRMSILVKSLLDFSRIGKNNSPQLILTKPLINSVIEDLANLIKTNNAIVKLVGDFPDIHGFEIELRQLFQNLISNAIKFRKQNVDPEIIITSIVGLTELEFRIQDNGIGIEEKHFEKIFQIFQRLNKTNEFEGYGIGLANCKKIAEMHGGRIHVESKVGEGSIFKIILKK